MTLRSIWGSLTVLHGGREPLSPTPPLIRLLAESCAQNLHILVIFTVEFLLKVIFSVEFLLKITQIQACPKSSQKQDPFICTVYLLIPALPL